MGRERRQDRHQREQWRHPRDRHGAPADVASCRGLIERDIENAWLAADAETGPPRWQGLEGMSGMGDMGM
jgi:hypothetical protein